MRRRASSIEEARFGEQERASANTGDPRGPARETRDGLHFAGFQHRCNVAAADDERIEVCSVDSLCRYRHAAATSDQAASPRQRAQRIEWSSRQPRSRLEDGEWSGEIENLMIREDEEADAMHDGLI
jgi:hypothetical protein